MEEGRGTFWRGIAIDMDTRLHGGRDIGKNEEEVALKLMEQLKIRGHSEAPPALRTGAPAPLRFAAGTPLPYCPA